MINSFELVKSVEEIYKETSLLNGIKNRRKVFLFIYLPNIIWILFSLAALFSIIKNSNIFYYISLIIAIISMLCVYFGHKNFLKSQYGISINDEETLFYNKFRDKLLEDSLIKENLSKIKNILEIETREETNHLVTYYFGFVSLVLLQVLLMTFEEYIKTDFYTLLYTVFLSILIPPVINLIRIILNRKTDKKKIILKKIERVIIEL